jgi:hypothetical protein
MHRNCLYACSLCIYSFDLVCFGSLYAWRNWEIENVCTQCAHPHSTEVSSSTSSDGGVVCGWVFCGAAWTTMLCQLHRVRGALVEHVYTHCWSTLYANWWLSTLLKHSRTASASVSASHQCVTIGRSRTKFLFHISVSPLAYESFYAYFSRIKCRLCGTVSSRLAEASDLNA